MIFFTLCLCIMVSVCENFAQFADTTEYKHKNTKQGSSGMCMKTEKKLSDCYTLFCLEITRKNVS